MRKYWPLAIPILWALIVWFSPLSFTPVPWPDDSAFYFVARELFKWPPRWVMLPQAPFEPTYRIWNFNTMPLYPVLIGLGRYVGIDGSWGLKLWPLSAWALTGSLAGWVMVRVARIPTWLVAITVSLLALDPILRWASVLVRPESLIGLFGMATVLALSFGRGRKWVPLLLALAAYSHFNSVHLLFPVIAAYFFRPRELARVALKTAAFLLPWIASVLWRWELFVHQMGLQWRRLAVGNAWLGSFDSAIHGLFQNLGNPIGWSELLLASGWVLWALIFLAIGIGISHEWFFGKLVPLIRQRKIPADPSPENPSFTPSAAWIIGGIWLFQSKPEVWFIYYLHLAIWSFVVVLVATVWNRRQEFGRPALAAIVTLTSALSLLFLIVNIGQMSDLSTDMTWRWSSYDEYIGCVNRRLIKLESDLGHPRPFRVWAPVWPDVTIELLKRHPDWELTRTNDFWERKHLGISHGHEVDAMVVAETIQMQSRNIDGDWAEHADVHSIWLEWTGYFLRDLYLEPGFKPHRHLCQVGRWEAFILMK